MQRGPVAILILTAMLTTIGTAGEPGLEPILRQSRQQTYQQVREYINAHPEAEDLAEAYRWILESARLHGEEQEVVEVAVACRQGNVGDATLQTLARRVEALGLTARGNTEAALSGLEVELKAASIREPWPAVDFGLELSAQAQLNGDPEAVKEILTALADAFFLNSQVRRQLDQKLQQLKLVGQPAPEIACRDLDGNPVNLADYRGRVVLIDFWATNCPPCLEEFPRLKRLHREQQPRGFEVVGISLDKSVEPVEQFQKKVGLPWRLMLSESDAGATRARYRVETIPSMFLVDRAGKIIAFDLKGANLRKAVEKSVSQPPTE